MNRDTPERHEKSEIIDIINWIDKIKGMGRQVFEAELKLCDDAKLEVFLSERHMKFTNAANEMQSNAIEMVQRIRMMKIKSDAQLEKESKT